MWVIVDERTALSLEGAYEIKITGEGNDLTITASVSTSGRSGSRTLKTGVGEEQANHFLANLAAGKPLDLREPPDLLMPPEARVT